MSRAASTLDSGPLASVPRGPRKGGPVDRKEKAAAMPDSPAEVKSQPRPLEGGRLVPGLCCRRHPRHHCHASQPAWPHPLPLTVMNGSSHSPTAIHGSPSTPNGFSNGPATSSTASLSTQHLPPACGARQLSKLKRFLTTLQQFGSDISPEIGDRVRTLVLGLVNSTLTIEEFHAKLQEATNFPLRPFVIPFLKVRRTCHPLPSPVVLALSSYANREQAQQLMQLDKIDHRLTEREWAEEWKHLNNLLNCIMDMVEKTRRSLTVLRRCQEADREELHHWIRRFSDTEDVKKGPTPAATRTLNSSASPEGSQPDVHREFTPRTLSGYMPEEIWRRAEEAVNEVKRQAMSELQRAVSDAERKAHELISTERAKMERALAEAKRQASEDALTVVNQQEDSSESCWNCGRKASETCSGCNVARYCGSFCQHRDWEKHHHVCGQGLRGPSASRAAAFLCSDLQCRSRFRPRGQPWAHGRASPRFSPY
ncbi:protein CBFA2T3 [Marmota marmota marmota]|uniref:protein CBFA2T3 n=1 Tax=Marmota marmota marmota TaxID=9994 RepID=UPI002093BD23|nr:protein CBFA2T3 [Marmota marmota marmota]